MPQQVNWYPNNASGNKPPDGSVFADAVAGDLFIMKNGQRQSLTHAQYAALGSPGLLYINPGDYVGIPIGPPYAAQALPSGATTTGSLSSQATTNPPATPGGIPLPLLAAGALLVLYMVSKR